MNTELGTVTGIMKTAVDATVECNKETPPPTHPEGASETVVLRTEMERIISVSWVNLGKWGEGSR